MSSTSAARRIEQLWYSDTSWSLSLQPLAWVFSMGVAARRWAYRRGVLRSQRIGVPVIVVGNITVGGTGKTPLVGWLVGRLKAEGFRPAIASRGYGGRPQASPASVTVDSAAEQVGDEPLLLSRLTGVPVAVCPDRVAAARQLVAGGADVIVADDGLQHYALARDFEIVVIDGVRRLGNDRMLPAGPLREPAERLREADLVMVNGGATGAGELGFTLRHGDAVALQGDSRRSLYDFAGLDAWVVAGIGHPERFLAELRNSGLRPNAVNVPDHGRVDLGSIRARSDWPILMTAKDAVKYEHDNCPDAWYVPVEVEMPVHVEAAVMAKVRAALGVARADRGASGDGN
jgi:tetraacyldisaccharide 4'-kinase